MDEEDIAEKKLKEAGRDVGNSIKKGTKNTAKKIMKLILKALGKKVVIIAAVITVLIVLLASFWYIITKQTFEGISKAAKGVTRRFRKYKFYY